MHVNTSYIASHSHTCRCIGSTFLLFYILQLSYLTYFLDNKNVNLPYACDMVKNSRYQGNDNISVICIYAKWSKIVIPIKRNTCSYLNRISWIAFSRLTLKHAEQKIILNCRYLIVIDWQVIFTICLKKNSTGKIKVAN